MPAKTSPATSTTTWYRTPPSPRLPRSPISSSNYNNNNNHHHHHNHHNPMPTSSAASPPPRVPCGPKTTTAATTNTTGGGGNTLVASSRPHSQVTRSSHVTTAAAATLSSSRVSGGACKTTTPSVNPPPPSPSSRLHPPPSPSHKIHLPPPPHPHGSRLASPSSRQPSRPSQTQPPPPTSSSGLSEMLTTGARASTTFPGSGGGGVSSLSKLPTSMTSGGSPKRPSTTSQGRNNKIVSPTRLKNITDRLPPAKTVTTPVHEQQQQQPGWKTKPLKEVKTEKERTSENKTKGVAVDIPSSSSSSSRREKREVVGRKSVRQNDENDENDGSGERRRRASLSRGIEESLTRRPSSTTTTEARIEAKTIPKRKKSERSNSDAELKKSFKKMANPSTRKLEEAPLQRLLQDPSEEPSPSTKPIGKAPDRSPKTMPTGKEIKRPTTLRIGSRARPAVPQKDQFLHHSSSRSRAVPQQGHGRSVEERLRDMDLDGAGYEMDACEVVVEDESQKSSNRVDDADEETEKEMNEDDVLSEDMRSPDDGSYTYIPHKLRSDVDNDDDDDGGVSTTTPCTTTHEDSTIAIYHDGNDDDDDNDNLTLDDHEPLSSDTGTYSLDFAPDYELREMHHYSLDTEFDVQESMLMCGVDHEDEDGGGGGATEGVEYLHWKTNEDRKELRGTGYPYVMISSEQQQHQVERRIEHRRGKSSEDCIGLHIQEAVEYPEDQKREDRTVLMIVEPCEEEEDKKEEEEEEEEEDFKMVAEEVSTMEVKEKGRGEKMTTYTIPENLPIGDVISFPSGAARTPQKDEEGEQPEVTQSRVTSTITPALKPVVIVTPAATTPPPPTTLSMTTKESGRRKARPGEIKRDATAPKARVSDARLRDASSAARGIEAAARRAKKKKSREEESSSLKVNERRSKRKMDAEKTREGTKKSARLFVDKDVDKAGPRPTSPCPSDVSTSSGQSQASTMSRVSTRLPIRALHASGPAHSGSVASLCSTTSGGGGSRGSRDPRVASSTTSTTTTTTTTATTARQNGASVEKKRVEGVSAPPRRPRLDNIKSTIPKPGRLPPRNNTDPVKAARPGGGNGPRGPLVGHNGPAHQEQQQQQQQHPAPHADQLRRLEAEVAARVAEARAARSEREETTRGLEALTVLLHHLTTTYDPFSTPRLKAEVVRLSNQLTEARLNLDESTAAVRRAQDEAKSREEQHQQDIQQLHQQHQQALEVLRQQHKQEIDLALEKHRKELAQFAEDQETQRAEVSRAHTAELEQLEGEWRNKLDIQHEKHLCALQDLNTQHTHKLRELESSRRARERELEEANFRLSQDQEALRQESRKLQETLLNDTDHRLMAVRKMCTSLKSEVDSLKTVVDMKNTEIHELRGRVVETERLGGELEAARERVRALQAKTEDLQAQMEKRVQQERHLVNEHRLLLETFQRESNTNKRLSLENEELAWKLRQREEIMSTSMPSSTLDLVSRAGPPRHQEGAASPQAAPRSPRVAVRSPSGKISPSKCDAANKQRRSRLGLSSEDGERGEKLQQQEVSFESPPPSPCVKAVVEKSNSVSFILDLNDSQSDDSFLDLPPSPRPRPQRTASLSAADRPRTPTHIRRVIHNNRANSLNRNGTHGDAKPKDFTRKPKEVNGKGKDQHEKPSKDMNGKSLEINGRPSSRRTTSESSEGGSEVERISPTGMAWTVPVHQPKSPVKIPPPLNGSPVRKRIEHHLLEDPEEDEYEETPSGTHQFIEVVGLTSSSEAASDSELSQCDIKEESSTDSDSDSSDGERLQEGNLGHKSGPWCPKEGAGEAMITDELLKQYTGDQNTVEVLPRAKRNGRRRIPSAPSSDSDENVTPHNEGNNDVSWSEDVDITSSSEMHEL